jgi:hypothetical protein
MEALKIAGLTLFLLLMFVTMYAAIVVMAGAVAP